MGQYDAYLVCENGHGVNDSYYRNPEFNKKFCTTCGAKTRKIVQTAEQNEGDYHVEGVIGFGGRTSPPDICKQWKSKKEAIAKNTKKADKDDLLLLETIFERFHLIVKQLRNRYNDRETLDVKDEYDTQDLLHALLRIYYEDIRCEEWNPSYAGGSTRSDFL